MEISEVRYSTSGGFPALELKINGVQVTVFPWQKGWLVQNGILAVTPEPERAGELPPVNVPPDPTGQAGPRRGFRSNPGALVQDETVMRLWRDFMAAQMNRTFTEGPIDF